MLYATVARPPAFGAKVVAAVDAMAKNIEGLKQIVEIYRGLAVCADSIEVAWQAKEALYIVCNAGTEPDLNTDGLRKTFADHLARNGLIARKEGDAPKAFIEDSSHGMWRRLYIVNFPRRFKEHEMDVPLVDKLKSELSGIFNWALDGFRRLRAKDFRFEESNSMKASKQDYKTKSNSALSFASEYLEKSSPDDSLRFKDVYELYETYSEKEGFKSRLKKNVFKKALQGAGFIIENSSRHNNDLRIFGVRMS